MDNDFVTTKLDPTDLDVRLDDIFVGINKLNKHMEKAEFKGERDPRTLNATEEIKGLNLIGGWPFQPWIAASFYNRGPNTVYIDINRRGKWGSLEMGEGENMDFSNSDERIRYIRYKCNSGETASLDVRGKY